MYLKVHDTRNGRIIAACDRELIGKRLAEGDVVLDLSKYASFYKGKETDDGELSLELKKGFNSVNLVGKKAVKTAINSGVVGQEGVSYINNIPHIQIYSL